MVQRHPAPRTWQPEPAGNFEFQLGPLALITPAAHGITHAPCIASQLILQAGHRRNRQLPAMLPSSTGEPERIFENVGCGRSGHKRGMIIFSAPSVKNNDANFPV